MAGGFQNLGKDSFDITELASLNDDISDDLIAKLEQEISEKMGIKVQESEVNENDDSTLFEEPKNPDENVAATAQAEQNDSNAVEVDSKAASDEEAKSETKGELNRAEKADAVQNFDDNFIKKYKAKLKNRARGADANASVNAPSYGGVAPDESEQPKNQKERQVESEQGDITDLSQGMITERQLSGDQKQYNDSLDYLDGNVKYSKYVIYIDPQNVDFFEKLTVKERKNLINSILRQQDDIALTKLRFKVIQIVIRHVLIAVITLAISVPIVYHLINASLEATINNHRSAQTNWQALYKEHGKITQH